MAVFDVCGRLTETGRGNQSPLVAFESARVEQLGDLLIFRKILYLVFYSTANFFPLTMAVFDVWGRLTETGSGNQSPMVAFQSALVEQLGDILIFCNFFQVVFYSPATFPH